MRDPPRKEDRESNVGIVHRIDLAAKVEIIPHVVEGHDDDDETANDVDVLETMGAAGGECLAYGGLDQAADVSTRQQSCL